MAIHNFGCGSISSDSGSCGCSCNQTFCCIPTQSTTSTADYAYFYNLTAQTVASQGAVTFGVNGPNSGVLTHTAGESTITFTKAGTYVIYVRAVALSAARFAVYINGAAISGGTFTTGTAADVMSGAVIVTVSQGAVMTLVNLETEAVSLSGATTASGSTTDTVNAELVAIKLA